MKLEEKRRQIDEIDDAIVELLNGRSAVAKEIALLKMSGGLPIADAEREDEILRRLIQRNAGGIEDAALIRIYGTILDESRRIQLDARNKLAANGAVK